MSLTGRLVLWAKSPLLWIDLDVLYGFDEEAISDGLMAHSCVFRKGYAILSDFN